jgi:hypothetical protein
MTTVEAERGRHGTPPSTTLMVDVMEQVVHSVAQQFTLSPRNVDIATLHVSERIPQ